MRSAVLAQLGLLGRVSRRYEELVDQIVTSLLAAIDARDLKQIGTPR
jgi:hypothetical protein